MKRKQLLPIFIALIVLAVSSMPSSKSSAQSDEADPDFIVTLALMAVADDRMDGVLDNSDLVNIYDLVEEHYESKKYLKLDEEMRAKLNHEKTVILSALDQKINLINNNSTGAVGNFLRSFVGYDAEGYFQAELDERDLQSSVFRALSGKYEPSQEVIDLLNQKLADDEESNVEKSLDDHTANTIEGGEQLVDGNYDFSAGLSKEAYNEQISQTKPLVFINNGPRDVVVSVEYFEPVKGLTISAPGLNLTVAGGNSVSAKGFPQGNYVFCAHWETDLDTNGDGIKDYDKMVTHIWLSSAHSDDPVADAIGTQEVHVFAGASPTPSGRCDGFKGEAPATETVMTEVAMTEDDPQQWETAPDPDAIESPGGEIAQEGETGNEYDGEDNNETPPDADFWDQGDGSEEDEATPGGADPGGENEGGGLTAAELSNQGQHNYSQTCSDDVIGASTFSASWEFTGGSAIKNGKFSFSQVSSNVYQSSDGVTVTFFVGGYTTNSFYIETNSEGQAETTYFTCTANIQ